METLEKLKLLGPQTCFEPAEEVVGGKRMRPIERPAGDSDLSGCVYDAVMPGGKRIRLLKTLLSSACERNCNYCAFRCGRDFRRASFTPDELARLFAELHQKRIVEGVFLSSGVVGSGPRTEDRLIDTAELLRRRYDFRGYIHLKIMPGAEWEQVIAAMRLADRVSVNLEAPNTDRLSGLAPRKVFFEELLKRLCWVEEVRRRMPGPWPSSTTQFVVGAAEETDSEILTTTEYLYHEFGLARAYFSMFSPVPGTPFEDRTPPPAKREHRLYQSSFLLRDYGFTAAELPFDAGGKLLLDVDPKLAWAHRQLEHSPVEVNTADRKDLLRVPGIGPVGAERLLRARKLGRLRELSDLRRLGVIAGRAAPFILLDGRRPPHQLTLWPT